MLDLYYFQLWWCSDLLTSIYIAMHAKYIQQRCNRKTGNVNSLYFHSNILCTGFTIFVFMIVTFMTANFYHPIHFQLFVRINIFTSYFHHVNYTYGIYCISSKCILGNHDAITMQSPVRNVSPSRLNSISLNGKLVSFRCHNAVCNLLCLIGWWFPAGIKSSSPIPGKNEIQWCL